MSTLYAKLTLMFQWLEDLEWKEGMVQTKNYTSTYLGFDKVSQEELEYLARTANKVLDTKGAAFRIVPSMGELCVVDTEKFQ